MPVLVVIPYTLILIALAVAKMGDAKIEQETFLNIADLFAGSYNGLAMSLLFGRYVSIEQSVRNTNRYAYLLRDMAANIGNFKELESCFDKPA